MSICILHFYGRYPFNSYLFVITLNLSQLAGICLAIPLLACQNDNEQGTKQMKYYEPLKRTANNLESLHMQ